MDTQTDGQTDGYKDVQTDGQTDSWKDRQNDNQLERSDREIGRL